MFITVITVIVVLSFLVFIHELGHYLAARFVNVDVLEFSIGFPPKIYSKLVGKTEYMISLIPIGGYVRLKGQNLDDEDVNEEGNYAAKSILQRFTILFAGPLMNFIVAMIFMPLVIYLGYEVPAYMINPPILGEIEHNSVAQQLGFQERDLILSINGQPVNNWKEAQIAFSKKEKPVYEIIINRQGQKLTRQVDRQHFTNGKGLGWKIKIKPIIGDISTASPAKKAGLATHDQIISINNQPVSDWSQISTLVQNSKGEEVRMSVLRGSRTVELQITPKWNQETKSWIVGIRSQMVKTSESFGDSIVMGFHQCFELSKRTLEFLYKLITREVNSEAVGGPIMIAKMVGQAAKNSVSSLLSLVAFISLQFAIFNLLPIPALDGGHIFFLIIEKIKGSALSKKFRLTTQKIGFSLLMFLILYVSVQDGLRLFQS